MKKFDNSNFSGPNMSDEEFESSRRDILSMYVDAKDERSAFAKYIDNEQEEFDKLLEK